LVTVVAAVGEVVAVEGMVDFQVIGFRTVVVEAVATGVGKDGETYFLFNMGVQYCEADRDVQFVQCDKLQLHEA
jgi:hypothetical protein